MLTTRRFCDPPAPGEGTRILVCRYRPRGVRKEDESWDEWVPELGPSRALHADFYSETGLGWDEYRRRYLDEMTAARPAFYLRALRQRMRSGEAIALLCSAACTDEARCHRSLLRELIVRDQP